MENPDVSVNFGLRGRGLFATKVIKKNELITMFPIGSPKDRQEGISSLVFDAYASPPIFFNSCVPLEADKLGYLINDGSIATEDYDKFEGYLKSIATVAYQDDSFFTSLESQFSLWFRYYVSISLSEIKDRVNCTINVDTGKVYAIKKIEKGNEILCCYGPEYWWTKIRSTFLFLGAYDKFRLFQRRLHEWWMENLLKYKKEKKDVNGDLDDDDVNVYVFERMTEVTRIGDAPEHVGGRFSRYRKNLLILSGMVFGTFENINGLIITVCPRDIDPNFYGPWSSTCPDDTDLWVAGFNERVDRFFRLRIVPRIQFRKDGSLERSADISTFLDELPKPSFTSGLVASTPPWSCAVWIQDTDDRSYKCAWSMRKERAIKIDIND